ncbi:MAG TPA: oligoribonuclease [Polyangiaceae bacterium]|nr:oligoribonuclease [Polyangiaceae bacterium]
MVKKTQERVARTQSSTNLAWLDLEMTGLDPQRDVILQAALIITDAQLNVLEEFVCDIWQPDEALERMVPFVKDMHETTGLTERVRKSKLDLLVAERKLMERVTGWCAYPAVLCGNTIGQDKRFVDQWMPGLSGYLSYRTIDVTSLKLLTKAWYGEEAVYDKPVKGEHDALVDIQNSIAELKHYRATVFKAV